MLQTTTMERIEGQGRYTEAALWLLQFVEGRRPTGRRFGPDADARWSSFKGDLETVDRIELMIRDADAEWPGAFGARAVYDLQAVAEDEPFGAQWAGLDAVDAEATWRSLRQVAAPATPADTLTAMAKAWGLSLQPFSAASITATDRLVVAGPSAVAATIVAFHATSGLDWSEQVIVIATQPAHRQLATAGSALLNVGKPTRVLAATATPIAPIRGARLVVSPDAALADRASAERLV